jgi:hypothetical protein
MPDRSTADSGRAEVNALLAFQPALVKLEAELAFRPVGLDRARLRSG